MGLYHLTAAFKLVLKSATEKATLIALANYANDETGECFPSIATLETNTSLGRSTIQRAIAGLEQASLLRVYRQQGRAGSNLYQLTILEGVSERDPPRPGAGPPLPRSGTRTVKEPSIEPSDARAKMLAWKPSKDVMDWACALHPEVDMDHQAELFRAKCISATIPARPDDAFRMWVARIRDLKTPPPTIYEKRKDGKPTAAAKRAAEERWQDPAVRAQTYRESIELYTRMGKTDELPRLRRLLAEAEAASQGALALPTQGE